MVDWLMLERKSAGVGWQTRWTCYRERVGWSRVESVLDASCMTMRTFDPNLGSTHSQASDVVPLTDHTRQCQVGEVACGVQSWIHRPHSM